MASRAVRSASLALSAALAACGGEDSFSPTGRLFVPGAAEGGEDLNADPSGTWTLSGRPVRFSQAADTFIRDAEFTVGVNRVETETTFTGEVVRLSLARTG